MSQELVFSINSASLSNLNRLSQEQSVISNQRLLELCDVAEELLGASLALIDDGLNISDALSYLSDGVRLCDYPLSELLSHSATARVSASLSALERFDRVSLVSSYVELMRGAGASISEADFLPCRRGAETFTYVRNRFSDEAYDVFSQEFSNPTVRYSSTFRECAEMLLSDACEYCLLPLEERGGVRLPTVSEIIFRNDFKINSVIPVFGPDGAADMKYALISKGFSASRPTDEDDRYLEIRFGAQDTLLADLSFAIEQLGMSVYRINTVTTSTEGESELYFSVVIRDLHQDFTPLLVYLTLFNRDFVPVGLYKNLE